MGASGTELALAAASLALAVGTKGTVMFALPVLALLRHRESSRWRRLPRTLVVGAIGLAAGSVSGSSSTLSRRAGLPGASASIAVANPCSSASGSRSSGPVRGLGDLRYRSLGSPVWRLLALVLAIAMAIAFAFRRRRHASVAALLAGVFAFFAIPLVIRWVDIAGRALAQVGAAVGVRNRACREASTRFLRVGNALVVWPGVHRAVPRRGCARRR